MRLDKGIGIVGEGTDDMWVSCVIECLGDLENRKWLVCWITP
jgi:hypothetical protein